MEIGEESSDAEQGSDVGKQELIKLSTEGMVYLNKAIVQ